MIETCEGDDISSVSLLQIIIATCLSVAVHDSHHGEHDVASLIACGLACSFYAVSGCWRCIWLSALCSAVSDAVSWRVMSDASDMPHGKASLSMGSEFGELLIKAMA